MPPRGLRTALLGALLILAGTIAALASGVPPEALAQLASRVWPVLLFVVGISVVAGLAAEAGVFHAIAAAAAWCARGRALALWLMVVAVATASTVFLSLDTTAVLLTPIVVVLARRAGLSPVLYALTTVWLANTASLLLPVSNLSNLLAQQHLGDPDVAAFASLGWPAQLAGLLVPCALLAIVFRRELRQRFPVEKGAPRSPDRLLRLLAAAVLLLLVIALVIVTPAWLPACIAAGMLVVLFALRRPGALRFALVPWPVILLSCGLFLVVTVVGRLGVTALLGLVLPQGESLPALLGMAAAGALGANLLNNLPAYLVLEPHAQGALATFALLAGVNAGAIVTPWASLATLLWHDRLVRLEAPVPWSRYLILAAVLAPLTVGSAVCALWLAR